MSVGILCTALNNVNQFFRETILKNEQLYGFCSKNLFTAKHLFKSSNSQNLPKLYAGIKY